ncbi:WGxxGxxG-CTERM domain-containing protein [Anabaena sphaerica FACHB-251]|uniref:WGxxGxxG-CTERM domain-containing protein n=1 Tax=Anabaena sphaerica FACHB-251 TaxID=2692883 RepID=A0A926WCS6_9NOST|nr:WGxxGxxG family protein [Anabaena sphaerica]MBD2292246.1 WGxxGxxG-CTERM domain-containing protein [Anabaena sphaerica FACHB-251]
MKSNFTKIVGAGVLMLTMGILPLGKPAQAQVNQPRTENAPDRTVYNDRNDTDWGWLGLIGLLGLAGLAGKKREEEPTRYRDPNAPGAASYRD